MVTQAIHKVPMLDADGQIHEEVNVLKDFAPPGHIPNVVLTKANGGERETYACATLLFTILTMFVLK